jgi:hypothetical protein
MESAEFGVAEKAMEYVAHLVEESDNIIMSHQSGLLNSFLSEIGDHGGNWIASLAIGTVIASEKGPNSCMGVFRLCSDREPSIKSEKKIAVNLPRGKRSR